MVFSKDFTDLIKAFTFSFKASEDSMEWTIKVAIISHIIGQFISKRQKMNYFFFKKKMSMLQV